MWLEIAKLAATALFGAVVTLATTKYLESKRRQAEYDKQTVQHQAIYTALFAIRNFIAESLNQIDDLNLARAPGHGHGAL